MGRTKSCLIIDDDPDDQEILLMCIRKINRDIKCIAVSNCVEAIILLASDRDFTPDYIFLDVDMPKMSGIDCLKQLKKIERLKGTKILMYSTTSDGQVLNESKRLGANDFIVKPTKTSELKEKLYNIFKLASEINVD